MRTPAAFVLLPLLVALLLVPELGYKAILIIPIYLCLMAVLAVILIAKYQVKGRRDEAEEVEEQ